MAKGPTIPMSKRIVIMMCAIVLFFVLLTGKLFHIQIVKGEEYQAKAISQQTRDITISAKRGTIYDRNYKALAISATAYKIVLAPSIIEDEEIRQIILDGLPPILGIEKETVENSLAKNTAYDVIARRVEKDVVDQVREFVSDNELGQYISILDDPKRYYPYNDFAAHVIGFVGSDNQGLAGLEAQYEEYLKGEDGRVIAAKNANNTDMPVEYEKYIEAQDGNSLVLTIDETIQHYLEKRLEAAYTDNLVGKYAAGIVMDVKTGGILAMAVEQDFDLNEPFTITDEETIEYLSTLEGDEYTNARAEALETLWKNVLVTDQYEPGSTFKTITSAIAIEEKKVDDNSTFYCNGYRNIAGTIIHCANRSGHGSEDFQRALCNSCNPAFMDIGALIGGDTFYDYVTGFGLRERTGIDLPGEGVGIFHSKESIGPVQLATISFGQTFKVTPIQLITAVSSIANGGKLMKPYVVSEIIDAEGNVVKSFEPTVVKQPISETTADKVASMMEVVVSDGGGRNAYVKGFRVCGKSGTSQKIDQKNEDGTYDHISSFIAFAPADDPQVAMLILLDEPGVVPFFGATIVGPIISNLMEEVMTYLDVAPQFTEEELAEQDVAVPQLTGYTSAEARTTLSRMGLGTKVIGGDGTVEMQIPAYGQTIPYTGTVILYTNGSVPDDNITVPNLKDMTASAANTELVNLGLNIKIVGKDPYDAGVYAVSQSPAAGTVVEAGTVVTVEFRSKTTTDD